MGPATDQFAFGLLSFQYLTGAFPYPEFPKDPLQNVFVKLTQPAAKFSTVWPEASKEADSAMERMLSTKPEERFPSLKEAFETFSQALQKEPIS